MFSPAGPDSKGPVPHLDGAGEQHAGAAEGTAQHGGSPIALHGRGGASHRRGGRRGEK